MSHTGAAGVCERRHKLVGVDVQWQLLLHGNLGILIVRSRARHTVTGRSLAGGPSGRTTRRVRRFVIVRSPSAFASLRT